MNPQQPTQPGRQISNTRFVFPRERELTIKKYKHEWRDERVDGKPEPCGEASDRLLAVEVESVDVNQSRHQGHDGED